MSTISAKLVLAVLPFAVLVTSARSSSAESPVDTAGFHTLTTAWRPDQCLDVELGEWPTLAPCNDGPHQRWKFTALKGGYYRLTTEAQGDTKCLDIFDDKQANHRAVLTTCSTAAGQRWKITPAGGEFSTFTKEWGGETTCLDIRNDGKANNQPILARCANVSGQRWKIATPGRRSSDRPVPDRPESQAAPDDRDGVIDVPRSFRPTFVVTFFDCPFVLPDGGGSGESNKPYVVFECARTKTKAVTCTAKVTLGEGVTRAYETVVATDTPETLAVATPRGSLSLLIKLRLRASTLQRRIPNKAPLSCKGTYTTAKEFEALKKQATPPAPEQDEPEEAERPSAPRDSRAKDPKSSLKTLGQGCTSDSECRSNKCKPVFKKPGSRSTCN